MSEYPPDIQHQMINAEFIELFRGNETHHGSDFGSAVKGAPRWDQHLLGVEAMGVYPSWHRDDGFSIELVCRWGCVDFDIKSEHHKSYDYETEADAHVAALDLQKVLAALGVTSWIERTRSHGRHVWVFADRPVPARTMRRALLVACGLADVSAREVNPKSEELAEGQLGNYVRLPYFGAIATPERMQLNGARVMLYGGPGDWRAYEPYPLDIWVDLAYESRTDPDVLTEIASYWVPPAPAVARPEIQPYRGELREVTTKLDGHGYVVFRDGPATGDRSGGLVYLAHSCARSGLTFDEAFAVLWNADERWGKYHDRADGQRQVEKIIERAYS